MLLLAYLVFSSEATSAPPILPSKFAWIIHLLEYHHYVDNGQPKLRTTVTEGQYYFDYTQRPIFATRQQNVVLPNPWRPDLPWNVFLGVGGIIRVGVFNYTSGEVRCALKGIPYGNDYWPRDFLLNPDTCHFKGITTLPEVFNGTMQDGKKGYAYYCTLPAFNMTAYVDIVSNQLLRVSIDENLPVWNKQIWDTVTFVEMDFVAGFWDIPQWLQNCPQL
jgi:hypothetical protein